MTTLDLRGLVRDIPDFPKPGILFKDITPLLKDPAGLAFRPKSVIFPLVQYTLITRWF